MIHEAVHQAFDTIVIGSGMGGLATASILAQLAKQRVLVLESHFKLGGFLHSFRRGEFAWDPGVHYIGQMQSDSMTRRCMDLVTGGSVQWHKMGHRFESFRFPDETVDVPGDPAAYRRQLIDRFPSEADSIKKYFRDIKSVQRWSRRWFASKAYAEPLASMISCGGKLASTNTQQYLDRCFRDPKLKAILTGQWMDYGAPPSQSAFGVHAIVASDYERGAYYPIGGSQEIANGARAVIEKFGGECLVNHPVTEILIRDHRAVGVRVEHKGRSITYRARNIVSNAGVNTTFNDLIADTLCKHERSKLRNCEPGPSAVVLYLGLWADPRDHGFRDCNYWLFPSSDHNRATPAHEAVRAFVSFGSLRNPVQESHTCQIVTLSSSDEWSTFDDTEWKRRGQDYEDAKRHVAERIVDSVETRLPGLKKLIEYSEVSSPLTVRSFLGHPRGQIYGNACSPDRLTKNSWSIGTSVKNLYLTGTDVGVPGVNSALMVGVMTAGKLLGPLGMPRIFARLYLGR